MWPIFQYVYALSSLTLQEASNIQTARIPKEKEAEEASKVQADGRGKRRREEQMACI